MDKNVDEVWYLPAYQTEQGKKLLQRKVQAGKRIFVHGHPERGNVACTDGTNCRLLKAGHYVIPS